MNELITYFITWTTYGTWLPGDARGWRKRKKGAQMPQPLLEAWSRGRMAEPVVRLNETHRADVEAVCREHAVRRGWTLHAVAARSNHVHLAVTCGLAPGTVRDQFKANATRVLRRNPNALMNERIWTTGGDTEIIDGEDNLEQVIQYILEFQDFRVSRRR